MDLFISSRGLRYCGNELRILGHWKKTILANPSNKQKKEMNKETKRESSLF